LARQASSLAGVELGQRGLLAGDAVQRVKALAEVAVLAADLLAVRVEVIHVGPVDVAALRGQAVGVHGGVHGPGVHLGERVVLVDEAHLVLVALQGGGKERLVHAGAVGALEVVEVDDRDLGRGIAADGAAGTSIEKTGSLARSKVSRRASVLPSVEIRKSTTWCFRRG
jgi:hypothetical protein